MLSFSRVLLTSALLLAPLSAAHAEQYLTVGGGWFDFNRDHDTTIFNFSGEYRGNPFFYGLLPIVGATVNTHGGAYGYGGFAYDLEVLPHISVLPELAIGGWHQGNSIDLGGAFEFHEAIEVDYKFDDEYRLGAQINHTSNAHIYDRNPGVNEIMATFSIPFGKLIGN